MFLFVSFINPKSFKFLEDSVQVDQLHRITTAAEGGNWSGTNSQARDYINRTFYRTLNGSHIFELEYRSVNGKAISIWDARIELWRIS